MTPKMAGAARACPCRACIPLNDLSEVRMALLCAKGNHRINAHGAACGNPATESGGQNQRPGSDE